MFFTIEIRNAFVSNTDNMARAANVTKQDSLYKTGHAYHDLEQPQLNKDPRPKEPI